MGGGPLGGTADNDWRLEGWLGGRAIAAGGMPGVGIGPSDDIDIDDLLGG